MDMIISDNHIEKIRMTSSVTSRDFVRKLSILANGIAGFLQPHPKPEDLH